MADILINFETTSGGNSWTHLMKCLRLLHNWQERLFERSSVSKDTLWVS